MVAAQVPLRSVYRLIVRELGAFDLDSDGSSLQAIAGRWVEEDCLLLGTELRWNDDLGEDLLQLLAQLRVVGFSEEDMASCWDVDQYGRTCLGKGR